MTKAERSHLAKVAALGCVICRRMGFDDSPAQVHHIRTGTGAGRRASHLDTIPLCEPHHTGSAMSLHGLGRKAFESYWGVTELELLAEVKACVT